MSSDVPTVGKVRCPHCGRWAWGCNKLKPLKEPIPCRGGQGLWKVPAEVEAEIRRQLEVDRG